MVCFWIIAGLIAAILTILTLYLRFGGVTVRIYADLTQPLFRLQISTFGEKIWLRWFAFECNGKLYAQRNAHALRPIGPIRSDDEAQDARSARPSRAHTERKKRYRALAMRTPIKIRRAYWNVALGPNAGAAIASGAIGIGMQWLQTWLEQSGKASECRMQSFYTHERFACAANALVQVRFWLPLIIVHALRILVAKRRLQAYD